MQRRTLIKSAAAMAFGATAAAPFPAFASKTDVYLHSVSGLAIGGFDPVAYFTDGDYAEGLADFETEWDGAPWRFASARNLELFRSDPVGYAPQYGGYCAFAVAQGATAPTVPEAWTIHRGRLYLNFSLGVRTEWRKDPEAMIKLGNQNWPGVLG